MSLSELLEDKEKFIEAASRLRLSYSVFTRTSSTRRPGFPGPSPFIFEIYMTVSTQHFPREN